MAQLAKPPKCVDTPRINPKSGRCICTSKSGRTAILRKAYCASKSECPFTDPLMSEGAVTSVGIDWHNPKKFNPKGLSRQEILLRFQRDSHVVAFVCMGAWRKVGHGGNPARVVAGTAFECNGSMEKVGTWEWDEVNGGWVKGHNQINSNIKNQNQFSRHVGVKVDNLLCNQPQPKKKKCPIKRSHRFYAPRGGGKGQLDRPIDPMPFEGEDYYFRFSRDANSTRGRVAFCEGGWDSDDWCENWEVVGKFYWDEENGGWGSSFVDEVEGHDLDPRFWPKVQNHLKKQLCVGTTTHAKPKPTDPDDPNAARDRDGYVTTPGHPHHGERFNPYSKRWTFFGLEGRR